MTRILLHTDDPDMAERVLRARHPNVMIAAHDDYRRLAQAVAGCAPEVVYTCRFLPEPFPREALVQSPTVRWVSNAGSGCNHLIPWDPARVTVTNSAGVAAEAMANFALGAMLHFALDMPGLIADQRVRLWPKPLNAKEKRP